MADPLVSVVIPAYNCARTLPGTVASVLAQTFHDFEVMIVDDGSLDDTLVVARGIKDSRVQVFTQPNGGASAARNTGIRAARGKYVALLDGDDLWLPHKLARQLEVLERTSGVFAVQSGAVFVNDALEVSYAFPCKPSVDALLDTLLFRNLPNTMSTLVISRHKFDEMGAFDTELEILEEWDMMIKVSRHCAPVSLEEPLSLYRVHPGNRSRDLSIHVKPGLLVLSRLFGDPTLPERIRRRRRLIYSHFYTMLAGGALRSGEWSGVVKWGMKGVLTHPACLAYFAAMPYRRLRRRLSAQSAIPAYVPSQEVLARLREATV
ncbi:MAG: glycosyltransferase [Isosphaeraceae bacterium]